MGKLRMMETAPVLDKCAKCVLKQSFYPYPGCLLTAIAEMGGRIGHLVECPMVETPGEHGRLIDADALRADVLRSMDYCDDILEIIDRQPTVTEVDKKS